MAVARQLMTAARTAPKAKGVDLIETILVSDEHLDVLARCMEEMAATRNLPFFLRDASNIRMAECVVLVGTRTGAQGLNCGHCGYDTCGARPKGVPCVLNSVDVGIALGSACSMAADLRVDTRVMFSAGLAAQCLGWLPDCYTVFALPVSASSKNPFFDRPS